MTDITEYNTFAEGGNPALATSPNDRERALAIIRNEHMSLALVLMEMERVVGEVRILRTAFDCGVLREMLDYVKNFVDKLHHPKEDLYLFARLSQRTRAVDQEISELQDSHAAGEARMTRLEHFLGKLRAGTPRAIAAFCAELDCFVHEQWLHMHLEESVVFRAAETYLLPADWAEIAAAFGENGDSRFGQGPDQAFQEKYSNIMASLWRGAYITR
jgi:hemerythrin-like domain-containing protein